MYALTSHFIKYALLVQSWTPFFLQNQLHSSRYRLSKVLETFLEHFRPYWHDDITQSLWIGWLHIHNFKPLFHHILKVLYWIRIWWLLVHQTYCHFQEIHLQWFELCKYVKVYFYSAFHRHESQITVQELKHNITKVAGDSAESAKWSWSGPIALVAHIERLCPS